MNINKEYEKYEKYIYALLKKYPIVNTKLVSMDYEDLVQECRVMLLEILAKQDKYRRRRVKKGLSVASRSTFVFRSLSAGIINLGKMIHAKKRMPASPTCIKDIDTLKNDTGYSVSNPMFLEEHKVTLIKTFEKNGKLLAKRCADANGKEKERLQHYINDGIASVNKLKNI